MRISRLSCLLVLVPCLALTWSAEGWGHSRRRQALWPLAPVRPAGEAVKLTPAPAQASTPSGQAGEGGGKTPEQLWQEFNLSPGHPHRSRTLLELARMLRADGQVAKARLAYALAASLFPGSPEATAARQERLVLDFYLDLGHLPPTVAHRRLLEQALGLAPFPDAPVFQEALKAGWQAVERQLDQEKPIPPALLDEVLALWELHPSGSRPPEAALLVARLLKERGLAAEAGQLLHQVKAGPDEYLRSRALVELLELAWTMHGVTEFLATLGRCQQETRQVAEALRRWPLKLGGPGPPKPVEAGVHTPALPGAQRLTLWEALSGQPLPPALAAYIFNDLAALGASGEVSATAGRLSQEFLERSKEGIGPGYYHDRVGLSLAKSGQFQAAQQAFQLLLQQEDPLWHHVGRARLLDLELARLRLETGP